MSVDCVSIVLVWLISAFDSSRLGVSLTGFYSHCPRLARVAKDVLRSHSSLALSRDVLRLSNESSRSFF